MLRFRHEYAESKSDQFESVHVTYNNRVDKRLNFYTSGFLGPLKVHELWLIHSYELSKKCFTFVSYMELSDFSYFI